MTTTAPVIFSPFSRHALATVAGGASAVAAGVAGRVLTDEPAADGSSPDRIDRAEAKALFSGPLAPLTVVPLLGAAMCLGTLYSKGRVLLGDPAHHLPAALRTELAAIGVAIDPREAALTKGMYGFTGAAFIGGLANSLVVYRDDHYETRHLPVD